MQRGTMLGAALAGVLLFVGATAFGARSFAADSPLDAAPAISTATQQQGDADSSTCPFAGDDADAMWPHMAAMHTGGSFETMQAHMGAGHEADGFHTMHGAFGDMMER